ncbi:hypothetical protein SAMN06269185_3321 [Natronoarchaeum philippinense]|uniref:Uncharacterized protein n=1 Tax=Natronoarchaeum philippinense TaxID=558529 RepID=A0A285PA37_NATPI|nr:hypothetical protein [Natronoarchaeum philippinense]SNZ18288.1 hypothetical protein SAMN06269185_3321 [Natronoarchaeum philippinense]
MTDVLADLDDISVGDQVDVTAHHDYASPLDVVAVDGPDEWAVPYGSDWRTATLRVETSRGTIYEIGIDSGAGEVATLFALDDGARGTRYGAVEQLALVEDDGDQDEDSDEENPGTAPITDGCNGDDGAGADDELTSPAIDAEDLVDTLEEASNTDDSDAGPTLPESVTSEEIEAAADKCDYLDGVAEELDVTPSKARSLLVNHGRYADISEASRYRGGVSQ